MYTSPKKIEGATHPLLILPDFDSNHIGKITDVTAEAGFVVIECVNQAAFPAAVASGTSTNSPVLQS